MQQNLSGPFDFIIKGLKYVWEIIQLAPFQKSSNSLPQDCGLA